MKSYKELEVWQRSINLALIAYKLTKTFPRHEQYGLISQVQHCATSIPANIAEGWGRGKTLEYIHFVQIARGSLMELETHFILAERLHYLNAEQLGKLQKEIEIIGKMLNSLINSLRAYWLSKKRLPKAKAGEAGSPNPQPLTPFHNWHLVRI